MNYRDALAKFSQYYKDRYLVEFPTILSLCDFRNKKVLEIGPAEGYFVKELSKSTNNITTTDVSVDLPFPDGSFDIVLSRWIAQNIDDLEKAVKEMCRIAKSYVVIVLPSEEGDEAKILEVKTPDKHDSRKKRIKDVKEWISESSFKVKEEKRLLRFLFPDLEEVMGIFSALCFNNKLSEKEKSKLKEFLLNKKKSDGIHIAQGASFICGYR